MIGKATTLPRFLRDLLVSPPGCGESFKTGFSAVARALHPCRDSAEIIALLQSATAGEAAVKYGKSERANIERSKATAWKRSQAAQTITRTAGWPKMNCERHEAVGGFK